MQSRINFHQPDNIMTLNRRDFVAQSALGCLALAFSRPGFTAGNQPGPHAIVKDLHGSPALWIEGKPVPPMLYTGNPTRTEYARMLGESGLRVFFLECDIEWSLPGGFQRLKEKGDRILREVPEAWFIIRAMLHPPFEWIQNNPDELVRYENGETMKPDWAILRKEYETVGTYSLASSKWREDGGKALADFIDMIEGAPFGARVAGYFLSAGGTWEWYYPGPVVTAEHYAGNSPAFKRSFSALLRETYGTEENLRKAWRDPAATFDNPRIPDLDDRRFSRVDDDLLRAYLADPADIPAPEHPSHIGSFLNPDTHRFVADFYKAWNWGTADSVIHFARVVKEKTGNTKVTGAFYGSYGCTHFQNTGTVSGVLRILDSGYVDFLAAPGNYENRLPGGVTGQREMQDSFRLRNRIFLVEEDTRTHLSGDVNTEFTGTHTLRDAITNMKRDFGRNLSEDLQAWWYDMAARGGWYDHPELLSLISRQQEVARKFYELDRTGRPEIALLYDQDSTWYASHRTHVDLCHMLRNLEVHRIGAPVAYHFHDDLALAGMPDYKLYVFLNCFALSGRDREIINARVKNGNKTALWVYAPGIINPDAERRFSTEHVRQLTGVRTGMEKGPVFPACRITTAPHPVTAGLYRDRDYGYFDRMMFGTIANVQPPGPAWSTLLYPCIYPDDPAADVLATFTANGRPALAAKDFGDWRSVYAAFKAVRADILRGVARYAGCHIYSESDDVLYASRHFVTLHASTGGEKILRFPAPCDPYEIYERKSYGCGVDRIHFRLEKGDTKTFFLHGRI